jgi:hypothetical protein
LSELVFEAKIPVQNNENPVPRSPKLTLKKPSPGRASCFPSKGDLYGIEIEKIDIGDRYTP